MSLDSSLFGTSHPYLATHLENLGYVYDQAGFGDSARIMVKQVLAMRRAVLADDNPAIGRTLFNLASLEHDAGSYRAAEPHYEEALLRMRRAYGPEHPDVVYATGWLGRNQFYLGQRAEAERNIRWALSVTDPNAVSAKDTVRFGRFLVTMLVDQRRWKEAEPLALRVFAIQDSLAGHAGPGDGGAARRDLRRDGAEGAGGAVSGTGGTGAVTINARLARTRAMTRTGQEAAMSTFTRPVLLVVLAAACSSQGGRPSHEAPGRYRR